MPAYADTCRSDVVTKTFFYRVIINRMRIGENLSAISDGKIIEDFVGFDFHHIYHEASERCIMTLLLADR